MPLDQAASSVAAASSSESARCMFPSGAEPKPIGPSASLAPARVTNGFAASFMARLDLGEPGRDRARDLRQVRAHRGGGKLAVARADGIDDAAMLGECRLGAARLRQRQPADTIE